MKTVYKISTRDGICYNVEASSYQEAEKRAVSPLIARHIALMIQKAMSNITNIERHRGPEHLIKAPLFDDAFFE